MDIKELDLHTFVTGTAIFNKGKQTMIGDSLRDTFLLFSTLFSCIGKLSDKIKVIKLNNLLKHKTLSEIFETREKTTLSYLMDFGFSFQMINQFFAPFFSGIFLESKQTT